MNKQQNLISERAIQNETQMEEAINEMSSSMAVLRTEADRVSGLFGFGRRILVPPDEIHVVVGDGRHVLNAAKERRVFGHNADQSTWYWLNSLTQVIKLKTISFTVPIRGVNDEGVEALDKNNISFRLWAHAVAKLDPNQAELAAQRVGLDTTSLFKTITQVGTAALVEVAATVTLKEIIANRNELANKASHKIYRPLDELGYELALLTVTKLDGLNYRKLIEQAETQASQQTTYQN